MRGSIKIVRLIGVAVVAAALTDAASAQSIFEVANQQMQRAVEVAQKAAQDAARQAKQVQDTTNASATGRSEQEKLEEAERRAQTARDQFRRTFTTALQDLKTKNDSDLSFYRTVFTILAIGGIVLALLSSICGFVKWSMTAGICGLLTTAVLTAPSVFSVRENLGYYSQISSQAYALQLEASLLEHPTQADVDRWKDRFFKIGQLIETPVAVKDPDLVTRAIVQGK